MVNVGTGGIGTRFIRTEYPFEEGLEAGTTKLKDDYSLTSEEDLTEFKEREGL